MRSYRQICGIAKALELIGDRWTLLIVRELLTRGSCRYTDLRNGLPGIATNLLAQRLRELEADDEPVLVEAANGAVTARVGRSHNPDVVLRGSGRTIAHLMLGRITLAQARKRGLQTDGDTRVLDRLRLRQPGT